MPFATTFLGFLHRSRRGAMQKTESAVDCIEAFDAAYTSSANASAA